jgi:S-adenosylmethionine decarboxylase
MSSYGIHLTLRLSKIERRDSLDNGETVRQFLETLVKAVDMRILAGPIIGREDGPEDKCGWSGVVILYESHAAIHTYSGIGDAFVDLFSCRAFSVDTVIDVLASFFGDFRIVEQSVVDRGRHWDDGPQAEMSAWVKSR